MPSDDVLRLNRVAKTFATAGGYGKVKALDKISLSIPKGEFFAVVGPSGSGKSTLINLIAGFIRPTEGEIIRNGQIVTKPGPDRVVVFQDQAVFPWYTVEQNIAYGLRPQAISKAEIKHKTREALSLVGLDNFGNMYPSELSGGMLQRTALARALVLQPDILLLDEPFSALDAVNRSHLQDELLALWRIYGWTVIFVTHNLNEAVYLADRVAVLHPQPRGLSEIMLIKEPRPRSRRSDEATESASVLEDFLSATSR